MPDLQVPQTSNDEISLKELILKIKEWVIYLKTKWVIILAFGIIGAGIGYGYAYFQKPTYTATLTFALEDEKGGGGLSGAMGLASSLGIDLGTGAGGAFSGANLIVLMKSRRLVEKTLLNPVPGNDTFQSLAEMYIRFNQWRAVWEKSKPEVSQKLQFPPNADRNKFSLEQDSVLGTICNNLVTNNLNVVQKDKKISIINIDVKSENELFAKLFTEALAKEVSDFYIETKSRKAKLNVNILEHQADSIRRELNNAITGVAVANDNTYNLNPALNIKRTPSSRRLVDVQANTAILTQLVTNLELAKITLRKETPLIQVIDLPILPLKKEKIGKLNTMITGGILAGFLIVLILMGQYFWQKVMYKNTPKFTGN
ncbi:MAG: Wzz/FepE/Etk N-terminal domain-containing protein [Sediminibacterium sp.]|nr:Wzz/FepE/Etk N-terminal domain-containing protein [Sediminibacterium sp.]